MIPIALIGVELLRTYLYWALSWLCASILRVTFRRFRFCCVDGLTLNRKEKNKRILVSLQASGA